VIFTQVLNDPGLYGFSAGNLDLRHYPVVPERIWRSPPPTDRVDVPGLNAKWLR